jgi:hypothetical protein
VGGNADIQAGKNTGVQQVIRYNASYIEYKDLTILPTK